MTERNVEIMDVIVDKMVAGKKLTEALKDVYVKRNVVIPFGDEDLNIRVEKLGMSKKTTYALMRGGLFTLADMVKYCEKNKITTIRLLGMSAGLEAFETLVDYLWGKLNKQMRAEFLIEIVERNQGNVREELM